MIKELLIFAGGIAVGSIGMYLHMKNKVQKAMEEMTLTVNAETPEPEEEKTEEEKEADALEYKTYSTLTEEYTKPDRVSYDAISSNVKRNDSEESEVVEEQLPGELMDQYPHDKEIEIITEDDYDGNAEIFTCVGCVYYVQSKVLVQDEYDLGDGQTPELDIFDSIGYEAENEILESYEERDIMWVRNYRTQTQYEISIDDDYYGG